MALDEIDAIISEAVEALKGNNPQTVLLYLVKIQGMLSVLLDEQQKWDRIKVAYEAGSAPKDIAPRFNVTSKQIRQKAWKEQWPNPNKLAKIQSIKKNKTVMHKVCPTCEMYFVAPSGHCKICPICQAFENMGKERKA